MANKEEKLIGKITHYYSNLGVAIIKLSDKLKMGDKIKIKGSEIDFDQEVESMQVEHEVIREAKKGDEVGLKIKEKAREGNQVYKI